MKLTKYLLLLCVAIALSTTRSLAVDIYLQTQGPVIPGEVTSTNFKDAWRIVSFSHSLSLPISGVGNNRSVGISEFGDLAVVKLLDRASVLLLLKVAEGSPIDRVTISFVSSGGSQAVFYKVILENVLISSAQQSGSFEVPAESITLNFSKITWSYSPQNSDGSLAPAITRSWDLAKTP